VFSPDVPRQPGASGQLFQITDRLTRIMYSNDTSSNPDDCGGEALQGIGDGMRAMMVGLQTRGGEVNTRDLALY